MQHKLDAIRHDILSTIDEIFSFTANRSLPELIDDRALQLILEREFEILGETLYRLRNIAPNAFEQIPSGRRIIAMRNILAHGYDRVDYGILWDAATQELDTLRLHAESIVVDAPGITPAEGIDIT